MGDIYIIPDSESEIQGNQNASISKQGMEANKFVCKVCNFSCNSFVNFKIHMQQTKHESIENISSQDPNILNKPESRKMNIVKPPEPRKMNIVKPPEPQKMQFVKYPDHRKMDVVKYPEPQKMNIAKYPETQKANTSKFPENPERNTTANLGMKRTWNANAFPMRQKTDATKTLGSLSEQIRRSIFSLRDYMQRTDREPLIGLEYVVEYRAHSKSHRLEPKYICEVCDLEADLVPMVEHLAGFRHRKLYLAKEYPYVLKAPSSSKEDRSQFMRRMALEIEHEEGTKMYKIDPVVKNESANMRAIEAVQARRRTRWDTEGNNQTRMNKALEYLESFEIDNDIEATTVTRLIDKLREDMKSYSSKIKQESLFPARVARAKDVAMAIMQNVPREKMVPQNFMQQNQAPKMTPPFNRRPPENTNIQSARPGPNFSNIENTQKTQNSNIPQKPQQYPLNPTNVPQKPQQYPLNPTNIPQKPQQYPLNPTNIPQKPQQYPLNPTNIPQKPQQYPLNPTNIPQKSQQYPLDPTNIQQKPQQYPLDPTKQKQNTVESAQKMENAGPSQTDLNVDDVQFLKKLMALLKCIPQSTPSSDNLQINSKLMMLKTLMVDQTSTSENTQKNQKMMMQLASLTQDTANTDNVSLNQLMMLMTSQNTAAMENVMKNNEMMMNMSIVENSQQMQNTMVQKAGMGQNTGQMNNMNMNQNVQNQEYGQMGRGSGMQMGQNTYQDQNINMPPECSNTSQNYGDFGYDRSLERNYLQHEDSYRQDNLGESGFYRNDEQQMHMPYDDRNYGPGMHGGDWNEPPYGSQGANPMHVDNAERQAPYTRVSLSPNKHNSRPFDYPEWSDGESRMQHKRPRLDMEHVPPRFSEKDHRGFHQQRNNAPGLTPDILKRIKGKDLFTVSAILGEYAENQPSE